MTDSYAALIQRKSSTPNRLALDCPACGSRRGRPCRGVTRSVGMTWVNDTPYVRIIPHEARLGAPPRETGPLFGGEP